MLLKTWEEHKSYFDLSSRYDYLIAAVKEITSRKGGRELSMFAMNWIYKLFLLNLWDNFQYYLPKL